MTACISAMDSDQTSEQLARCSRKIILHDIREQLRTERVEGRRAVLKCPPDVLVLARTIINNCIPYTKRSRRANLTDYLQH